MILSDNLIINFNFINIYHFYFRGSEIKPEVYETRNCYPVQSKETIELIEKQLNAIIQCKFLFQYCLTATQK